MNRSIAIKIAVPFAIPLIATLMTVAAKAGTVPPCANGSLSLSVTRGGAAAGTVHYKVHLRNTTTSACTLYGFPGVSLRADGRRLGRAASRDHSTRPALVILPPGASALADLGITDAQNYPPPSCRPERSDRLRVYAPGQTVPGGVRFRVLGCSVRVPVGSQLSIGPVTPGSHGTVS